MNIDTPTLTESPTFQLSDDQQEAMEGLSSFLLDPDAQAFTLSGYAGCGKSTLVRYFLDNLEKFYLAIRLVFPDYKPMTIALTATTHKAAESLGHITGESVRVIHSYLGLRVANNFATGESGLALVKTHTKPRKELVIVDEASFLDPDVLGYCFSRTEECKFIFIGDPAQLTPIKCSSSPAFKAGFPGVSLTKVMRQAEGNPIIDLATKFRNTVNTGEWFSFNPDGRHVVQVKDESQWEHLIVSEFNRPCWKHRDSKVLAWTNKAVINYNQYIRNVVKGDPNFQKGDVAICNSFCTPQKGRSIRNDSTVYISDVAKDERFGIEGNRYLLDGNTQAFMPHRLDEKKDLLKLLSRKNDFVAFDEVSNWIDLRAQYSCTVNKAQGSTFDKVFIDLNDISGCNNGNQIARMLYVAVSRARETVYFYGDLA